MKEKNNPRVFKTRWFAKECAKAKITDSELCIAFEQILKGQVIDLGGGVFKKRLNENQHRCIILGKGIKNWIYIYLFAKSDRDNIKDDELSFFRKHADHYGKEKEKAIEKELATGELLEICMK